MPVLYIRELRQDLHEQGVVVYLRHKYNGVVYDTFLEDEIIGGDRIVTVQIRIDPSAKRVQKLSAGARVAVDYSTASGNGSTSCRDDMRNKPR